MMLRRVFRSHAALCCPFALLLAFSPLGCGDDSTPSGVGATAEEQVQGGTAQLGDFVDSAGNTQGAQLLDSSLLQDILNALGAPVVAYSLPQPPGISPPVRRFLQKLGSGPRHITQVEFGTYVRDLEYTSGPFPGWRLEEPNNPSDGFVFRFGLDDGVYVYDDMGMPLAVRGEFRLLHLDIDDAGTPDDPNDDYLSGLVIEIAATPNAAGSLPLLVRLGLQVTFDAMGELQTLRLGDPQSSHPGDSGASFIGPVLLAVEVDMGLTTLDILTQVYDSEEDFVVRLDLSATEEPESGLMHSAGAEFGWGSTRQPTAPPWEIALLVDNFRMAPMGGGEIGDVSGQIAHNRVPLATLSGDTSEVPVDLDGDEIPDMTCVNVMVTFSDAPDEPQNLCQALPAIQELFGNGSVPKLIPLGGGWR